MSSYIAPHRYLTRFQVNKQLHPLNYLNNMSHLNLLIIATQTTHDMERIHAFTKLYTFLQTFQLWKTNLYLRNSIQNNMDCLMNYIEIEKILTKHTDIKMEDALFELEDAMDKLEVMMQ
jgi:hypothetical protein